jgi:hypothetical protein
MNKTRGWGGIFKSYSVVEIVPVTEMTKEDWELLDWDNLRNRAKNRIAEKAENLAGFAMIRIFDKAKAKSAYLLPLTEEEAARYKETGEVPFGNEADDLDLSERALTLEEQRQAVKEIMLLKGGWVKFVEEVLFVALAILVMEGIISYTEEEDVKEELRKMIRKGAFTGDAHWDSLALCIELRRLLGEEKASDLIEECENEYYTEDDVLTGTDDGNQDEFE